MDNNKFIDAIAADSGLTADEVAKLLDNLGEIITETGEELDSLSLPRFGTFETIKEDEQLRVDLSTGKQVLTPPSIHIEFIPGGALRNAIDDRKKGGRR